MFRIYTKEKISKEIFNVNLSEEEVQKVMKGNLFLDHPELEKDDYIIVQQENAFEFPTYRSDTNTIEEMTKYERYQNGLYELQFNEVIHENNILILKEGQYVDESGVLQTIPKIEGTKIEWNWETHVWEEKATTLEVVQAQYVEYQGMDTPSTLKEMELQDPSLSEEYINMMIELRSLIYTLSVQEKTIATYTDINIPEPSEELKNFKNKFKLTK